MNCGDLTKRVEILEHRLEKVENVKQNTHNKKVVDPYDYLYSAGFVLVSILLFYVYAYHISLVAWIPLPFLLLSNAAFLLVLGVGVGYFLKKVILKCQEHSCKTLLSIIGKQLLAPSLILIVGFMGIHFCKEYMDTYPIFHIELTHFGETSWVERELAIKTSYGLAFASVYLVVRVMPFTAVLVLLHNIFKRGELK